MQKLYVTFGSPVSKPHLYSWLRANPGDLDSAPVLGVLGLYTLLPITLKHPSGIPPTAPPVPALPGDSEGLST